MKLYLTGPSHKFEKDSLKSCHGACMDYAVGPGGHLQRSNRAKPCQGGLLVLTDERLPTVDSSVLVRELGRECTMKGYKGVVADFEKELDCLPFLNALSGRLTSQGMELFVPERYGEVDGSVVLVSTAISGGSLSLRLDELCEKFGAERLALDVERLCMDFLLPSSTGFGETISEEVLNGLLKKRGAQAFFSIDLCAYYFTYSENGQHHFILYDNAPSIRKKLDIGRAKGVTRAFLMYSEVADILGDIVS